MSFWATVKNVNIQDLKLFKSICEKNGLRWEEVNSDTIVARAHDMNAGGPSYSRHLEIVKADNKHKLRVDNDSRYSSITARFGANGGTLVRDYTSEFLQRRYNRMGARTKTRVLDNGWVELKVSAGGGRR